MNHSKCGQKECGTDATCSMVWPGAPRANFCRPHADKAIAVAMVLGMDVRSLDIRSVDGEAFPYPSDLSLDDACHCGKWRLPHSVMLHLRALHHLVRLREQVGRRRTRDS